MDEIKLTGLDVLKVRALPGEHDYAEGTKPREQGIKYRRYTTGGKVFIHPKDETDEFFNELAKGGLHTVVLSPNEQGQLSLTDFVTWNQVIGQKKNACQFEAITPELYKINTVKELEALS